LEAVLVPSKLVSLIPWSRVLLEKPTVAQLVKSPPLVLVLGAIHKKILFAGLDF
jgi:hypothetical protein